MGEVVAGEGAPRRPVRRRERLVDDRRTNRVRFYYNDAEFSVVQQAAEGEGISPASYVARAALAVAAEELVPVSVDAREVLQDLIQSRRQLRRAGNNLNQVAHVLNADGTVTGEQLRAVLERVDEAVRRVDEATLQVMRERRPS